MAPKADKGKNAPGKNSVPKDTEKKPSAKPKKQVGEDDDEDLEVEEELETTAKKGKAVASSKKKSEDDDDDDDAEEAVDDWEKPEEEENWDPDFDEFDVPKSRGKKAAKKGEEEEEFKIDEEFKDMDLFNEGGGYDDDEEDF